MIAIDYKADKVLIENYILSKLKHDLIDVSNRKKKVIEIDLDQMEENVLYKDLTDKIKNNTRTYINFFKLEIDKVLEEIHDKVKVEYKQDKLDIFLNHLRNFYKLQSQEMRQIPSELVRRYNLYVKTQKMFPIDQKRYKAQKESLPKSEKPPSEIKISDVRAVHLGKIIIVSGQVTYISDIEPMIKVAVYSCQLCSATIYQEINSLVYKPQIQCISEACRLNRITEHDLILQTRVSKFVKIQTFFLQEVSTEGIPRNIKVIATEDKTNICEVGDYIKICGIFLPIKRSREVLLDSYLEPHTILQIEKNRKEKEMPDDFTFLDEEVKQFINSEDSNKFDRLSQVIAPDIENELDLKKALLLQLVGGTEKKNIRNTIHINMVGNPGRKRSLL